MSRKKRSHSSATCSRPATSNRPYTVTCFSHVQQRFLYYVAAGSALPVATWCRRWRIPEGDTPAVCVCTTFRRAANGPLQPSPGVPASVDCIFALCLVPNIRAPTRRLLHSASAGQQVICCPSEGRPLLCRIQSMTWSVVWFTDRNPGHAERVTRPCRIEATFTRRVPASYTIDGGSRTTDRLLAGKRKVIMQRCMA